jgi:hypothetical protein
LECNIAVGCPEGNTIDVNRLAAAAGRIVGKRIRSTENVDVSSGNDSSVTDCEITESNESESSVTVALAAALLLVL